MARKSLSTYRQKRDFAKTPEPAGAAAEYGGNRFVVHKHHATADHYDLRLEADGVLKCWAVPKGPSLNPADKRLAVETEDHPLEYLDFEGVIPEGQYGGGPMIVWDAGVWAPMDDIDRSLETGAFKFRLAGEKLNGGWMLARLKPKPGEDAGKRNWLLFKERDPSADTDIDVLAARPESVKSGRRIEELAAEAGAQEATPRKPVRLRPGGLKGAVKAPAPDRVRPQLATASAKPPDGDGWLHEIKLDGYRTMAHVGNGATRLITRNGLDWTRRYGDLAEAFAALPCKSAVIDGEIVVLDDKGVSSFAGLQQALSDGRPTSLHFFAFDLVHLDGWDLGKVPLDKRKALLAGLLSGQDRSAAVQYCDHVVGGGPAFFEQAAEIGLEGIVSKRVSAPYIEGRSKTWAKTKTPKVGDFPIVGYTASEAAGGLGALAVGELVEGEAQYRGKVGTGFDARTLKDLLVRLEPLRDGADPVDGAPKDVIPVRPVLTAHVHYATRTADNALRHAVFKGLREVALSDGGRAPAKRLITDADLASIWVTNPTRRMFGRTGATKLDVAVYYAHAGNLMLPHLLGRPVSLVRCPSGKPQDCFFQRHAFKGMPPSVATFDTADSDGEARTYLAIEDAKGFLALAQFGVVEFHSWGSLRAELEKPDRIVFDLDPGEGVAWREIVEAAVHVRGALEALGLVPFAKTTGSKGIHVTVPIVPRLDWKQVHEATGAIAAAIADADPQAFTASMSKEQRKRRIFIDFHRNARGATAVAPYSLRARPNLPASTPLSWDDLESIDDPADLNYASLPGLLASAGDPWQEINDFARELRVESKAAKRKRR